MSKIKDSCIQTIKGRAEILPVVESFFTLKRNNASWMACCPFHNEKTPSFHVTPAKNFFKCFGCGESGDPISFLQNKLNIDFMGAVKWLANFYNIELEFEDGSRAGGRPKPEYKQTPATPDEPDGSKQWEVSEEWTMTHLETIFAKNILAEAKGHFDKLKDKPEATLRNTYNELLKVLDRYHCRPLLSHSSIKAGKKHTFYATDSFPMFLFDHGTWQKIYKPLEENKEFRFMYHGTKPQDVVNGLDEAIKILEDLRTLEEKSLKDGGMDDNEAASKVQKIKLDNIILCSGERDSMNVAAMGFYPIWLNSETARLYGSQYSKLRAIANDVYNLPDIDDTGVREAHGLAMEYLDLRTIWLPEELKHRKDNRYGKSCKDIRDYLKYYKRKDFENLVKDALPYRFWEERHRYDKKGQYIGIEYDVRNARIYNFLKHNGFARLNMDGTGEKGIFVYRNGNMVKEVPGNEIKVFLHEFLKERHSPEELRNTFYRTTQLGESSLSNIPMTEMDFNDRVKDGQYYFFKNCVWHVSKDGIKEYPNGKIEKYVWEDDVIEHDVSREDDYFTVKRDAATGQYDIEILNNECLFLRFLIQTSRVHWQKELEVKLMELPLGDRETYRTNHQFNITSPLLDEIENEEQKLHLINKMYSIGHLLHRYVDAQKPWCVFAMDNRIGDEGKSYGGSGKSVVFDKALRRMLKKNFYLNGRNKELTRDKHIYDGLTEHHRYLLVDDADQYIDFGFFFTNITGEINVNPKNMKPYTIQFHLKPKMAITSNYTLRNLDPSTERRLLYTVFSDYYHENKEENYHAKHEPKDDFGKNLFDDFTEAEFNRFYNTMAQCLKVYLSFEKIEPPLDQVNRRNLLTDMGANFKAWADVFFSEQSGNQNTLVVREWAYDDFSKNFNWKGSPQKFMQSLKSWCRFQGYEMNPKDFRNKDGRIIRNRKYKDKSGEEKSKTFEMIFVGTKELSDAQKQAILNDNSVLSLESTVPQPGLFSEEIKDEMPF